VTWFKVDDSLAFHPKVLTAGNAAMGLWVRAGSLASQILSDGLVSTDMARQIGTPAQVTRLLHAGLWIPDAAGYRFHEWSAGGRNPTRQQVEARRDADAERIRKWREQRAANGALDPPL